MAHGLVLGDWPGEAGAVLAVVAGSAALQRAGRPALAGRVLAAVVPVSGAVLLAARDHHGAALLFGAVTGALTLLGGARSAAADGPAASPDGDRPAVAHP